MPLVGSYLAIVIAWSSLGDALPLLLLDACLSSLGDNLSPQLCLLCRQPLCCCMAAQLVVVVWRLNW